VLRLKIETVDKVSKRLAPEVGWSMVYTKFFFFSEFVGFYQDADLNNGRETTCLTFAALRALPENIGQLCHCLLMS
jgi:hypothetical protein